MTETESPPYRIDPLSDHHDRAAFASGVEPLDRYLRAQAGQDSRRRVSSCFILTPADEPAQVLGYYTLSALSIALTDLPPSIAKRLPRYPIVPATLMGRLAIDSRHRGKRLGELLFFDACSRVLRSEIATFALVVDAKDAAAERFYTRYRFLKLLTGSRRMFLPITEITALFA
ncbi:MAG TPA: GNAT family N-acetyltransferase [Thermoanaerobaculia bacterium]|nr:GNAT family N-acetyltransferase [Thermoanaerobaculia bacterium]